MTETDLRLQGVKIIQPGKVSGVFGPLLLIWSKRIDASGVWQSKISQIFTNFINILLALNVLHGFVRLSINSWENNWSFSGEFFLGKDLFVFWVACLALSYLIFRLFTHKEGQKVLSLREFDELIKKDRVNYTLDIALSFRSEALLLIEKAWIIAKRYHQSEVNSWCLLLSILESKKLIGVLARLGVSREDILVRVKNVLTEKSVTAVKEPILSLDFYQILLLSYTLSIKERFSWVGVAQVLEAIVITDIKVQDLFSDVEINSEQLRQVVNWLAVNDRLFEMYQRYRRLARYKPKNSMNRALTAVATPYLDRFGHDLTLAAKYGALELCIGRHEEIEEIFRIIESGSASVVLVGFAGVGKTSIIEGIAQLMVTEDVPDVLRDKRMVLLSLPRLIAGANSPGMLEERVLRIHHEIIRAGNVVLVIENIHDVYGINSQGGEGLDLSEVFADVIGDDRFLVLATSTPVEYRRSIIGKALGNKLQKVDILETDKDQTMEVLIAKVNYYEYKYKIFYSLLAITKSIEFSSRFMHDYYLPEKAIKILEEVGVFVLKRKGEKSLVSGEDVAKLVSEKIDIPLTKLTQVESEKLLNLEDEIHKYIINQAEAVRAVSSALRRARTELRDEKRPIVNLLFLGPTGVGKTELAKTVALTYFGTSDDMVRLDMSEYQNKDTIGRLIGTEQNPKAGLLTEGIKENPYAVLLLDEIEKAHPDILNLFLQVMDDGRLTDWSGQVVDFTNTIIIATSNAGSQFIQDQIRSNKNILVIKEMLLAEKLKGIFRPEFLNRFDNIVVFTPLDMNHIREIARLMIKKSQSRLLQKGIHLEITEEALAEFATLGFDPSFGARPMRRVVQEHVDDALAKFLLSGRISRRDIVILEPGGNIKIKRAEKYL
jgi:ATP-dependent Clp protease ATP-binding subunit ClpC